MEVINIIRETLAEVNTTAGFNTMTGGGIIGIILLLAIAIGILAILLTVTSNIDKYRRFKKFFKLLAKSFSYCAYGMLTVAVIGFPVYLGYIGINMASENPESTIEVGKWIGIITGTLIAFGVVGYITKNRIWKRLFKYHKMEKNQRLYKEQMKELPTKTNQ